MQQLKLRLETIFRSKSRRYHVGSSGWVEIFCPFCNDATRKHNPDHGHLYYMPDTNYFNCFRCSEIGSITKLLTKYNVYDEAIFHKLSSLRRSDLAYSRISNTNISAINETEILHRRILRSYEQLSSEQHKMFFDYLYLRVLDINILKYFIMATFERNNILGCSFYNRSNQFITTRYINHPNKRYHNSNKKPMYYFQDIRDIIEYEHIVMSEGVFDVVNLSNYYYDFKDGFFIAINGNQYISALKTLISTYLRIGHYTISIVFDTGLFRENNLIKSLEWIGSSINPNIKIQIFKPTVSKDSSEFMLLNQII